MRHILYALRLLGIIIATAFATALVLNLIALFFYACTRAKIELYVP